jgi:hypothetical protein
MQLCCAAAPRPRAAMELSIDGGVPVFQQLSLGLLLLTAAVAAATPPRFHYGVGNGLLPGGMGDPQLYWDAPTRTFHIFPQYSPATKPPYAPASAPAHGPDGWGHTLSSDLIGDFKALPCPFGPEAISRGAGIHTAAGTGCTLRINASHVGSLVNGEGGWQTTNNYAALVNSDQDPQLINWTEVSHGIQGNHTPPSPPWMGAPGNHIPAPFGLIGNVVAYHNRSEMYAVVSTSVGDPKSSRSLPAFMRFSSTDFATWRYRGALFTHNVSMNRAECGDFFPLGPGSESITPDNVDFGLAGSGCRWVLMWSTPDRNGPLRAGVVYLVGDLVDGSFVPATHLQAAEYGRSFYASQTVLAPTDGRVIMGDLGGGVQSLPRRVTLNAADLSLSFVPTAALAARHDVGSAVGVSGLALGVGDNHTLGCESYGDALDVNISILRSSEPPIVSHLPAPERNASRASQQQPAVLLRAGGRSAEGGGRTATPPSCRCTHESSWCCHDGPIALTVASWSDDGKHPTAISVVAGGRVQIGSLPLRPPVDDDGEDGQTELRVVIDRQVPPDLRNIASLIYLLT